ncbi:maleylpyruvate isomerase family mycothiol-dependent enzyme [Nocardioides iriomotensis]|uniref:Maleylpyruvate isomerase family mycothiol-dependent enzyme n=1 Tax=Nocardioides iriomotensis TaxID=715784 RepID=A0A4Q5IZI1_9ACTN|nr:maleylpyruvate isomerase family mycothiol-dependent enzyme [Nocardioides iriomotensis]RYU11464.1 maleylpyruvate isomerase family mycothiol-dependent enzyme [Nocardioides iriomotensis]
MSLSVDDCTSAIARYSTALGDAARGNLDARVEHCPEWSVADLVHHVTDVHWFWRTIAAETLDAPPEDDSHPPRAEDDRLVNVFEAGAREIVDVLAGADQSAACWTWYPSQQDVAFITRHQVQEAMVHAWDAANAAGRPLDLEPRLAADSIDEFLTTSLAEEDDARSGDFPPFEATICLRATDTGDAWTLTDGGVPGSLVMIRGGTEGVPTLTAPAGDLLLWIYQRRDAVPGDVPADVVDRFRRLSGTD